MSAREQTGRWCVQSCWPSPCFCGTHRRPRRERARRRAAGGAAGARACTPGRSTGSPGRPRTPRSARFQARRGLAADGIVGPRDPARARPPGRHPLGRRPLRLGHRGWDVAALQFELETHGFPLGPVDGGFGAARVAALDALPDVRRPRRRRRRRPGDAARAAPARRVARRALRRPINAPIGDRYGPRGSGFHAGPRLPRRHRHAGHRGRAPAASPSPATTTAGA